jgi:hypothetical protein
MTLRASLRYATFTLSRTGLRRPLIWIRHLGLDSTDVMIASFPRSGSTWFRFLMAHILTGKTFGFDDINYACPQVGLQKIGLPTLPGGGRLIKTHEPYRNEYRKAIYVARDPRDVAISLYLRGSSLGAFGDISFDDFLPLFLGGEMTNVGSWQKHVTIWLDSPLASADRLLVVRFEDLRTKPDASLARALEFLGITVNPGKIDASIAANSLAKMRQKEDSSRALAKNRIENGRFVRQGSVAGWRNELSAEHVKLFDLHARPELERLRYS